MMNFKEYAIVLILILVSFCSSPRCESVNETKHVEIEAKTENTTSTLPKVESRFFDVGGMINQLFSGFNQGGAVGENSGFNLPSNSQFYPGVPAQNWYPQVPINQGNRWNPNQQNQQLTSQNQGLPLDINFNRQGSINNINQPGQNFNQGSLGQYPANLNGNPINGGWNQNGQGGNLQNSAFQQGQPQLDTLQGQGPNINSRPNEFDTQNQYNNNGPIGNGFNNPQYLTSDQGQSFMTQNNNRGDGFNNNQYNNRPNSQNPPYPNNQGQNFNRQGQNNLNHQNQYPNGQLLGDDRSFPVQGTPQNQYEQVTAPNYLGPNNMYQPQGDINNNQAKNINQQDTNVNNNNGMFDQPFSGTDSLNNNEGNDQLTKQNQQTVNSRQDLNFNDGAIKFPDDDDDSGNNPMATRIATTRSPQIISSTTKIAIVGKPVFIPTKTVASDQIAFINNDSPTAQQKQCVQNCPTSSEYSPVCGTDNVSYFNPERLICARNCGLRVFEARQGDCSNITS